jgi:hypothetical protein
LERSELKAGAGDDGAELQIDGLCGGVCGRSLVLSFVVGVDVGEDEWGIDVVGGWMGKPARLVCVTSSLRSGG